VLLRCGPLLKQGGAEHLLGQSRPLGADSLSVRAMGATVEMLLKTICRRISPVFSYFISHSFKIPFRRLSDPLSLTEQNSLLSLYQQRKGQHQRGRPQRCQCWCWMRCEHSRRPRRQRPVSVVDLPDQLIWHRYQDSGRQRSRPVSNQIKLLCRFTCSQFFSPSDSTWNGEIWHMVEQIPNGHFFIDGNINIESSMSKYQNNSYYIQMQSLFSTRIRTTGHY
jgi:hypothetical protein